MPSLVAGDLPTHYQSQGSGRPLVLIHGALVDSHLWDDQLEAFAPHYRVITYDLRGHGQTGGSTDPRYTVELLVRDLHALLEALGVQQPLLCGLSLGGMVAQHYAARHPVRGLVLCDTAVSSTLFLGDRLQYWLLGAWAFPATVRLMGARRFVDWAVGFARLTRGEGWLGRDERVRAYVTACMRRFETLEMSKVYDLILHVPPADLGAIRAPTLILNGEHESPSVFRHTRYMLERLGRARAEVIPGAGHVSNMENPVVFSRQVLGFLGEAGG